MKPIQVSASILCADFTKLGEEIKNAEAAGVDRFHVDVMDGHFVPNLTVGPLLVKAIRPLTKLPIEAHLMIDHPTDYIDAFMDAGADIIGLQAECYGVRREKTASYGQYPKEVDAIYAPRIKEDMRRIQKRGRRAYVVINPGTPLCIDEIIKDLDGVLLMTVNPGFASQKFISEVLPKIQQLSRKYKGDIAVDGGINDTTGFDCVRAGANILVTASFLFGAPDRATAVRSLKALSNRI